MSIVGFGHGFRIRHIICHIFRRRSSSPVPRTARLRTRRQAARRTRAHQRRVREARARQTAARPWFATRRPRRLRQVEKSLATAAQTIKTTRRRTTLTRRLRSRSWCARCCGAGRKGRPRSAADARRALRSPAWTGPQTRVSTRRTTASGRPCERSGGHSKRRHVDRARNAAAATHARLNASCACQEAVRGPCDACSTSIASAVVRQCYKRQSMPSYLLSARQRPLLRARVQEAHSHPGEEGVSASAPSGEPQSARWATATARRSVTALTSARLAHSQRPKCVPSHAPRS